MYSGACCCGEKAIPLFAGVPLRMSTSTYAGPTYAHVGMVRLKVYVCVLLLVARFPVAAGAVSASIWNATGTVLVSKTVAVR